MEATLAVRPRLPGMQATALHCDTQGNERVRACQEGRGQNVLQRKMCVPIVYGLGQVSMRSVESTSCMAWPLEQTAGFSSASSAHPDKHAMLGTGNRHKAPLLNPAQLRALHAFASHLHTLVCCHCVDECVGLAGQHCSLS